LVLSSGEDGASSRKFPYRNGAKTLDVTYSTIAGQRQRPKYFMKSLFRESLPPAEEPPPAACTPRSSRIFAIDPPHPAGVLMSCAIFDFDRFL
jgi:hypothetical protein